MREFPFQDLEFYLRALWNQVCEGNLDSAVPEGKEDRCGSCTD